MAPGARVENQRAALASRGRHCGPGAFAMLSGGTGNGGETEQYYPGLQDY